MHYSSESIFPAHATGPMSHCSTLMELADGTLLSAWMTGAYEPAPDQRLAIARKPAGTERWCPPEPLPQSHGRIEGQPVFLLDDDGILWLYGVCLVDSDWTSARIHRRRSHDLGRTWEPAEDLCLPTGWMLRSRPLKLGRRRWVLPAYDEVKWQSIMLLSDNDGRTWTPSTPIVSEPGNIHACLVTVGASDIMAYLRTGGDGGWIWRTYSRDGGFKWTTPRRTRIPNPNSGLDLIRASDGSLILAFNDSTTERTPLCVATSNDNGATWPHMRTIATGDGEYSYPTLTQSRSGKIMMTYTHRRDYIRYVEFDLDWLRGGVPYLKASTAKSDGCGLQVLPM